jgi:hypothetical protein
LQAIQVQQGQGLFNALNNFLARHFQVRWAKGHFGEDGWVE